MANIKYEGGIDEIQGVRSGVVFSQSRSGLFVRSRVVPTQARTNRRTSRQSHLAQCVGRWREVLTAPQRAGWRTLGDVTDWENPFGIQYNPTGFNLYCRTNTLRLFYGLAFIDTAPGNAVCTAYGKVLFWNEETLQLYVSGASATPADYQSFFDVSTVLPEHIVFFSGPFNWNANASGAALKSDHALGAPGRYAASDRLAVRWRDMAPDGSLSDPSVMLYDVEGPSMFAIQTQLASATFTNANKIHWNYIGSVRMYWAPNSAKGNEIIPLACRVRHISVHINIPGRTGTPPAVEVYLCKNQTYSKNFAIPGTDASWIQIDYTENDITGFPFADDDRFAVFMRCNCAPGEITPANNIVVTVWFEIGDFT